MPKNKKSYIKVKIENHFLKKIFLFLLIFIAFWYFNSTSFNKITKKTNEKSITKSCNEADTIDFVSNSVVRVISEEGEGTGFVIGTNGYILTNYHIIGNNDTVRIIFKGNKAYIGKVYNWDKQIDLAIIKIDKSDLKALTFGEINKLSKGQTVFMIGFPFGQEIIGEPTISRGSYSALRESNTAGLEYLQVDISVNPGNSGSPIFDDCGKVYGIMQISITGTEGIKLAISSTTAKSISDSLISTGPKIQSSNTDLSQIEPQNTIIAFYEFISLRQLDKAFALLTNNFIVENGDYKSFVDGFNYTLNDYIKEVKPISDDGTVVAVNFIAAELKPDSDTIQFSEYRGTYSLVLEDGFWKIDAGYIEKVN